MKIDCISDLHGYYPTLKGGDLLIIAGDLTARDLEGQYFELFDWIHEQQYSKKIVIAGNHDRRIEEKKYKGPQGMMLGAFDYLCDSGTEIHYFNERCPKEDWGFAPYSGGYRTLKIWGSPWTKRFEGMNPNCMAFTVDTEEELSRKWDLIPNDVDILITHCPPEDILDELMEEGKHAGSVSLLSAVRRIKPIIHVFGHIHECGGLTYQNEFTQFVNASYVNEYYKPINKPIRIEL